MAIRSELLDLETTTFEVADITDTAQDFSAWCSSSCSTSSCCSTSTSGSPSCASCG